MGVNIAPAQFWVNFTLHRWVEKHPTEGFFDPTTQHWVNFVPQCFLVCTDGDDASVIRRVFQV